MATADELRAFEMVDDHEKRLKKLERAVADKLDAQEIEAMIAEKYPTTAPQPPEKPKK